MKVLNGPWQNYANIATQLLFWVLFILAGFSYLGSPFEYAHAGQWLFWPIATLLWWWLVVREVRPFTTKLNDKYINLGTVTLVLKLNHGEFGSRIERNAIHKFTDRLDKILGSESLGTFDGDEFGNGECTLFMYSGNPEKLFERIKPILMTSGLAEGAVVDLVGPEGSNIRQRISL